MLPPHTMYRTKFSLKFGTTKIMAQYAIAARVVEIALIEMSSVNTLFVPAFESRACATSRIA